MISSVIQWTRMPILERVHMRIDSGKISKNLHQRTLTDTVSITHTSHQFTLQTPCSELLINIPWPIISDSLLYLPHSTPGGITLEQVTSGTDFGIIMLRLLELNFIQQVWLNTMTSTQCKVWSTTCSHTSGFTYKQHIWTGSPFGQLTTGVLISVERTLRLCGCGLFSTGPQTWDFYSSQIHWSLPSSVSTWKTDGVSWRTEVNKFTQSNDLYNVKENRILYPNRFIF